MAYSADIDALGCQHRWSFDGDYLDDVGSANGTNTGTIATDAAICKDATNCITSNGVGDRVTIPNTADINNSAQSQKAIGGWFMATAVNTPFTNIWNEGNTTTGFRMVMGFGNAITFEVDGAGGNNQIYSDTTLVANRAYHLLLKFSGNGFDNEVSAYLDGVKQLDANPADRQPDYATLAARTPCELSDPAGTVGLNGNTLLIVGVVNGKYNQWASFNGTAAALTDTEIREELFEKGAIPDTIISAGTESAMQTALDLLANTVRPNEPLCIEIEAVTGDGDLTLDADNITFDPLASIHISYLGTGTLTWKNLNGSDASIVATPNGGTITLVNPATLNITGLVAGSEIRIYTAGTTTELAGIESSGTSFNQSIEASSIDISILSLGYENKRIKAVDMTSGDVTIDANQQADRQYENP